MPHLEFTPNLRRHLDCPAGVFPGATVREVLDAAFAVVPRARGYVVDETGALREHVAVFVDGEQIVDRRRLADPVGPQTRIFVMQALSGG